MKINRLNPRDLKTSGMKFKRMVSGQLSIESTKVQVNEEAHFHLLEESLKMI